MQRQVKNSDSSRQLSTVSNGHGFCKARKELARAMASAPSPPRPPPQPDALLLAGVRAQKRNRRIGTTTVFVKLEDHSLSGAKALIVYKGQAAIDSSAAECAAHPEEGHKNCWLLEDINAVTSGGSEATVEFRDGRRQTLVCPAEGLAQQFASELNWQLRAQRIRGEGASPDPPPSGAQPPQSLSPMGDGRPPPSATASPAPSTAPGAAAPRSARSSPSPSPISTKRVLRKTTLRFRIGATKLVDPNGAKSCNPYVVIFTRRAGQDAEVTRTAVLENVSDPDWDTLQLDIDALCGAARDPDAALTFRVINEDRTPHSSALRQRCGVARVVFLSSSLHHSIPPFLPRSSPLPPPPHMDKRMRASPSHSQPPPPPFLSRSPSTLPAPPYRRSARRDNWRSNDLRALDVVQGERRRKSPHPSTARDERRPAWSERSRRAGGHLELLQSPAARGASPSLRGGAASRAAAAHVGGHARLCGDAPKERPS